MGVDKHLNTESTAESLWHDGETFEWHTDTQHRIRSIISRAAVSYLVLFLAFGLVLSMMGVDPLTRNWLMPKALLVFVGSSTLIALINTLLDYSKEAGIGWYGLAQNWFRLTFKKRNKS